MSAAVSHPPLARPGARARSLPPVPWRLALELVIVAAVAVLGVWTRHPPLDAPLWIDEGLSVGIASHPLGEIPHLLRLDGSPPLYYVLLHVWMSWFGTSEASTHALSLTCALLAVPAAWWAARPFGAAAGTLCAAIIALNPFVGLYAVETRMYALVLLLGLLCTGAFIRAFVEGRRPFAVALAVLLAALLYTHAWGGFLAVAMALVWLALLAAAPRRRRRLLVDGVIAFGGAIVLFAPWLPTLAYQTAHTGAPWSHRPSGRSLTRAATRMLGGRQPETLLLLVGAGLLLDGMGRRERSPRGGLAVAGVAILTLLAAWWWSHTQQPAWALRYLVVVLAPLAVALAAGLGRAPVTGAATVLLIFALSWVGHPAPRLLERKSNVAAVAHKLRGDVPRGTLVLSIQPEQVANLAYYLPNGHRLRWATPLGRRRDPGVTDWRDAMSRLRRASYDAVVGRSIGALRPGRRLLVVAPHFKRVDSPWTIRLKRLARSWPRHIAHSRYVRLVRVLRPTRRSTRSTITAYLYVRNRIRVPHRHHAGHP
jgi:hypothetical protein